MKKIFILLFLVLLINDEVLSQVRGKIVTEPMTPKRMKDLGLTNVTNSVSNGLNIVAKETFVYLSARNIGSTAPITSATFILQSKPTGSTATLQAVPGQQFWTLLKPDINGQYVV